ncbi:TetR/AcrR family transcriptional regulator [Methylobacterium brachythecii]|uniref:AcrR family transcriptional regulator n=1 Tax=Methylobacterium brachythecii TaxID=1176177 RepID=A0A7W6APV9_9HYPH|nr:TetR/AcrR family transcriptional regulator [Methylobacterium brachythecii]MBB3903647.1 AcrR family transcriptional regulator [Methylobacterium brachythecii]GLS44216.1 TetR family transcriptional regulator [Methylobacterium brachythecii]
MARPKAFDTEIALDAAMGVFREHGYEGTSAEMLLDAMKIGRQSLYDTFGDKWRLYQATLRRYCQLEGHGHVAALRGEARAFDGVRAMIDRVVADARPPCLGVSSACEFGQTKPELDAIKVAADHVLRTAMIVRIEEAQSDGDVSSDLQADEIVDFLYASFAGIRIAARSGADKQRLEALGRTALRALK